MMSLRIQSEQTLICSALLCALLFARLSAGQHNVVITEQTCERLPITTLPNAHRIHQRLIFGGQPVGNNGFRALKALGVRTVVSVDGFKPDLVTAGLFGLKYVHLPHGYDGISERRSMELAAVVRNLPGPVYVHCHHGRHRSPAAATVAGIISGLISKDVGDQILKSAGTSHRYSGLYRSVASAVRATDSELDLLNVQWPESVEPPPLVKTMTDLEHTVENLSALSEAGWPAVGQSSYASAQHQALMLREQMTEFLRVTMSGKPSAAIHANYRSFIKASKKDARQLDDLLAADITTKSQRKKASALLMSIKQRCADCHSQFRD